MRRPFAAALAAGIALLAASAAPAADGPDPNRVWVSFKPGAQAQVQRALEDAGARLHHRFDGLRAFAVTLPPRALDALRRNPGVERIEADPPRYPMAQVQPYGIGMVQAPLVWARGASGDHIKVCVIDSGIHAAHEDFQGVALEGHASPGQSWNTDTCGHGSHVAGTIAAKDNALGVVGVATGGIGLVNVKVFDGAGCGWSYSSTLVNAAQQCVARGAKVINMSLGGSTSSTTERNAFQSLYDQGVLHVAAAGNGGSTRLSYPASYDSVISVAAVDSAKALASFSQRNSQVELAAPGVGVLSTVPQVSATASVAGVAYLVTALDGSAQTVATGALADGARCTTSGGSSFSGKVVLCERGDISFGDKVKNVFNGGGTGVIIHNNAPGGFSGTLGSGAPGIPAVSMSQEDGLFLRANRIGNTASLSTVPDNQGNGYAYYDGTSMATPHVAGVAALVWSANPAWTNVQIRQALAATAEDLGAAGRDNSFGWGLVRADAALTLLQGSEPPPPPPTEVVAKVGSLVLTSTRKGLNFTTRADVGIVDASGAALGGVSVTGCFSGAFNGCSTGTADAGGQLAFTSGSYRRGSLSFCVTAVTGSNVASFDNANACRSN